MIDDSFDVGWWEGRGPHVKGVVCQCVLYLDGGV